MLSYITQYKSPIVYAVVLVIISFLLWFVWNRYNSLQRRIHNTELRVKELCEVAPQQFVRVEKPQQIPCAKAEQVSTIQEEEEPSSDEEESMDDEIRSELIKLALNQS